MQFKNCSGPYCDFDYNSFNCAALYEFHETSTASLTIIFVIMAEQRSPSDRWYLFVVETDYETRWPALLVT